MNEILKKRIEELPYKKIHPYNTEVNDAYNKGFEKGAEYALSHQWISVDEALPDGVQDVLVSASDGSVDIAHYLSPTNTWWAKDGNIIAPKCWMPIPKMTTD